MLTILRFLLALICSLAAAQDNIESLRLQISQIAATAGKRTGVAIRHIESGAQLSLRGDERFVMASVYKFPIAVAFLQLVDEGKMRLDDPIPISKADLRGGYSPIAERNPNGGVRMAAGDLLRAMVSDSDNTACDLILKIAGGPAAVNRELIKLHAGGISVDRTEGELSAVGYDPTLAQLDTATPDSMAALLVRAYKRELLKPRSSALLLEMMTLSRNPARLSKLLPAGTTVTHKTGTGPGRGVNDVGIVTLPGKAGHLVIVVLVEPASRDPGAAEAAISRIARTAYDYWTTEKQ